MNDIANSEAPHPIHLVQSIEYQDKRNNRVLFREEGFSMVLFALQAGQDIPAHRIDRNAYLQCLEGRCTVLIDAQPHILEAGQLLQMPAQKPHAIQALTDSKLLLTR